MDAQLSIRRSEVEAGGPITSVLRLAHTALDGTIESFANLYDNISERLVKQKEPFPEPLDGMVGLSFLRRCQRFLGLARLLRSQAFI